MNLRKIILSLFLACAALSFAQSPPVATSYAVVISGTLPSVCTAAAPCTFGVSRASGACTGSQTFTYLGSGVSQAGTYTDSSVVPGTTYCYFAQTIQGTVNSIPSSNVQVIVPPGLAAPGTVSGATITVQVQVTTH